MGNLVGSLKHEQFMAKYMESQEIHQKLMSCIENLKTEPEGEDKTSENLIGSLFILKTSIIKFDLYFTVNFNLVTLSAMNS